MPNVKPPTTVLRPAGCPVPLAMPKAGEFLEPKEKGAGAVGEGAGVAAAGAGAAPNKGFAANDAAPKGEAAWVPLSEGVAEEEAAGAAGMPPAPTPVGKRLLVPDPAPALPPPRPPRRRHSRRAC